MENMRVGGRLSTVLNYSFELGGSGEYSIVTIITPHNFSRTVQQVSPFPLYFSWDDIFIPNIWQVSVCLYVLSL